MCGVFATLEEGKDLLKQIGFKDGENVIKISIKGEFNSIYDHSKQTTKEIAAGIQNWAQGTSWFQEQQTEEKKFAEEKPIYPIAGELKQITAETERTGDENLKPSLVVKAMGANQLAETTKENQK